MNARYLSQSIRLSAVVATLALAGIAFASSPQENPLYSFKGPSAPNGQDGEGPNDLISDEYGNLYGVTTGGGICLLPHYESYPCGIVFELSPPASTGGAWSSAAIRVPWSAWMALKVGAPGITSPPPRSITWPPTIVSPIGSTARSRIAAAWASAPGRGRACSRSATGSPPAWPAKAVP